MLKMIRLAALAAVLLLRRRRGRAAGGARRKRNPPRPPPAAPAAAPAAPAACARARRARRPEIVENPYGLEAIWKGGDLVAKTTLAILVIMSMGSWYIIITKLYEQYADAQPGQGGEKKFWNAPSVRAGRRSR